MTRRPLFWKIYPSFVLISFISLLAAAIIAGLSFKSFYYQQRELDLEIRAKLVREELTNLIQSKNFTEIQVRSEKLGNESNTRFTIILPSGKVIGDSKKNPQEMDNHRDRPEISNALESTRGVSIRYSHTLKLDSMYLAIPITIGNEIVGVIRTSTPLTAIQKELESIYYKVAIGFIVLILIIALSSWWASKKLSLPLEKMKVQAQKIAQGDFSSRVKLKPSDPLEPALLGEAINDMAIELDQRIKTVLNQKNEQEAVFSSMVEGVIAIDTDERILRINQAAYDILEISGNKVEGMIIQEIIRNSELQNLILFSLKQNAPFSQEIEIQKEGERFLYIQSAPLLDNQKSKCGIVIVINDITKIKILEKHRKEFVANVSHELRTPLTSIQGFAETLMNPSVTNQKEKDEFIKTIHTQASRLGAIVEDLLSLSRIEKESDRKEIELADENIKATLSRAISLCQDRASAKNIRIELNNPNNLKVRHNAPLIEQAIVNLVDNAINYSPDGSIIQVNSIDDENSVTISVIDQGIGIPKEHLSRLFERFYRVDKARSRKLGGTGLGLSIVKHIALAHNGSVNVTSEIQKGSVFSINLPAGLPS
jgi:two-component system phosphate regulon sensor histidine kinase PhoR